MFWIGVLVGFFTCLAFLGIWSTIRNWLEIRSLDKEIKRRL